MAKKGRKSKPPYRDSNGNDHIGLYRKKNGRFAASGYPNKTFGTDETDAIRRFYEWQAVARAVNVPVSTNKALALKPRAVRVSFHIFETNCRS